MGNVDQGSGGKRNPLNAESHAPSWILRSEGGAGNSHGSAPEDEEKCWQGDAVGSGKQW